MFNRHLSNKLNGFAAPLAFALFAFAGSPVFADHFVSATAQAGTSESLSESDVQEGVGSASASASYSFSEVGFSNSQSTVTGDHITARADATAGPLASEPDLIATVGRATATWIDGFKLIVPDDFVGTPALRFQFAFDGSLTGNSGFNLSIYDGTDLATTAYETKFGIVEDTLGLLDPGATGPLSLNVILDYTTPLTVDGLAAIQFSLDVSASADETDGFSVADFAQNSLRLTSISAVDEFGNLIAEATLTSDSGFGYQFTNSIPEVPSSALAALGVLAVLARRAFVHHKRFQMAQGGKQWTESNFEAT